MSHLDEGKIGEQLAVEYLEKLNYQIIDRNFNCKLGEIDIVAKFQNEIRFIEVKYRHSENFVEMPSVITKNKMNKFKKACLVWLNSKKLNPFETPFSFDYLGILNSSELKYFYIKNIFSL